MDKGFNKDMKNQERIESKIVARRKTTRGLAKATSRRFFEYIAVTSFLRKRTETETFKIIKHLLSIVLILTATSLDTWANTSVKPPGTSKPSKPGLQKKDTDAVNLDSVFSPKSTTDSSSRYLLEFTAQWCPSCQDLEYRMSKDLKTQASIKKLFTLIKIDIDDPANRKWVDKYKVKGVPTLAWTDSKGESLFKWEGTTSPEQLLKISKRLSLQDQETEAELVISKKWLELERLLAKSEPERVESLRDYLDSTKAPSSQEASLLRLSLGRPEWLSEWMSRPKTTSSREQLVPFLTSIKDLPEKKILMSGFSKAEVLIQMALTYRDLANPSAELIAWNECAEVTQKLQSKSDFLNHGACLRESGKWEKAVPILSRGLKKYPHEMTFDLAVARSLSKSSSTEDWSKAKSSFQRALSKARSRQKFLVLQHSLNQAELKHDLPWAQTLFKNAEQDLITSTKDPEKVTQLRAKFFPNESSINPTPPVSSASK